MHIEHPKNYVSFYTKFTMTFIKDINKYFLAANSIFITMSRAFHFSHLCIMTHDGWSHTKSSKENTYNEWKSSIPKSEFIRPLVYRWFHSPAFQNSSFLFLLSSLLLSNVFQTEYTGQLILTASMNMYIFFPFSIMDHRSWSTQRPNWIHSHLMLLTGAVRSHYPICSQRSQRAAPLHTFTISSYWKKGNHSKLLVARHVYACLECQYVGTRHMKIGRFSCIKKSCLASNSLKCLAFVREGEINLIFRTRTFQPHYQRGACCTFSEWDQEVSLS